MQIYIFARRCAMFEILIACLFPERLHLWIDLMVKWNLSLCLRIIMIFFHTLRLWSNRNKWMSDDIIRLFLQFFFHKKITWLLNATFTPLNFQYFAFYSTVLDALSSDKIYAFEKKSENEIKNFDIFNCLNSSHLSTLEMIDFIPMYTNTQSSLEDDSI